MESLCGMLNADAGYGVIVFGVSPNGEITGVDPGNLDKAQVSLAQLIRDNFEPSIQCEMQLMEVMGKQVLRVSARRKIDVPYYEFKGKAFIREGTTTRRLSQQERHSLLSDRRVAHNETSSRLQGIVLFACVCVLLLGVFLWIQTHSRATSQNKPPEATSTSLPATPNNPPGENSLVPGNSKPQGVQPTSFVQLETVRPARGYSLVQDGRDLKLNFFYKNSSPSIVEEEYDAEAIGFGAASEKDAEQKMAKKWAQHKKEFARQIADSRPHYSGQRIGVGLSVYKTANIRLEHGMANDILTGAAHIYVYSIAVWKDMSKRSGKYEVCWWLQHPSTPDLSTAELIWHTCEISR